jgi:hypothetical protein
VQAAYELRKGGRFGFRVGSYDKTKALVIDPVLFFATYTNRDTRSTCSGDLCRGRVTVVASGGALYVTGVVAVASALKPNADFFSGAGASSIFVDKFNATGTARIFSTVVGGSSGDSSLAMAVDSFGAAYVGGRTNSADLPVSSGLRQRSPYFYCPPPQPFQPVVCSTTDVRSLPANMSDFEGYVFKLNPSGSGIVWSSYLGGASGWDQISSLALSSNGMLYAAGYTNSPNKAAANSVVGLNGFGRFIGFPTTTNAFQQANASIAPDTDGFDQTPGGLGFFTAFSAATGQINYSTLIGVQRRPGVIRSVSGNFATPAAAVAALPNGNAVVVGTTPDFEFITCNQCSRTFPNLPGTTYAGTNDGWVEVYNPSASGAGSRVSSRGFGSVFSEHPQSVATDSNGGIFIAGYTDTTAQNGATPAGPLNWNHPFGSVISGDSCYSTHTPGATSCTTGWVIKLESGGARLGGTDFRSELRANAVTVDSLNNPWIAGFENNSQFVFTNPLLTPACNGCPGTLVARFDNNLTSMPFSTRLARNDSSIPNSITADGSANVYVAGLTHPASTEFFTPGAFFQFTPGNNSTDAFVVGISPASAPPVLSNLSTSPNPAVGGQAFTLTINGTGFDPAAVEVLIGSTVIGNSSITTKTATQLVLTTTQATASYNVTARNGSNGTASNALSLNVTVGSGAPAISTLSPNPAAAGSVTLTINGSNFNTSNVQVEIGGTVIGNAAITTKTATQLVLTTTLQGGSYNILARNGGAASNTVVLTVNGLVSGQGLHFVPITPCRTVDTRSAGGIMARDSFRNFTFSNCGVPANASAVATNITLVPSGLFGFLSVWPAGLPQPVVSTMNSLDGRIKANAAIVGLGVGGAASIYVTDPAHVILDVNGYFVPAGTAGALAFYPTTPCRVLDTRSSGGIIPAQGTRAVSGGCLPSNAQAYSLNVTVVPPAPLGFLSLWPVGQSQPTVSTLNNLTGTVVANAAILRAGTNGAFNAFVTEQSHFIADLNGYFAAPGQPGALAFYPSTPCRIFDTRAANGAFGGPVMAADASRNFTVPSSACNIPASAQAYVTNATVVPSGVFGFLTLWPAGQTRPTVSTLNAVDGALTSNAAIVPAGSGGAISVYTSNGTHLLLDISGYFAP